MAIEELDDIAEDMASKLGIYGEERSYWTAEFKNRIRKVMEVEAALHAAAQPRDPLSPPATTLIKLGSLAVHVDELLSPDGHAFDRVTIQGLLNDSEITDWLKQMDKMAFLPKKRS